MFNVLFVCIGNSCRSQMAEGFARKYGSDVLHAESAGLAPAPIVQPLTVDVMAQKNVGIREQFPKNMFELDLKAYEVVVNMSGAPLPSEISAPIVTWNVVDPMGHPEAMYIEVRDRIETLVMQLILELRRTAKVRPTTSLANASPAPVRPSPKAPVKSEPSNTKDAAQRFGFGRVRRSRD